MAGASSGRGTRLVERSVVASVTAAVVVMGIALTAHAGRGGTLDRTFSEDGRKLSDFFDRRNQAKAVALQPHGRIVVAGWTKTNNPRLDRVPVIARYKRTGKLDRSFAANGRAVLRRFRSGQGSALLTQPNGRIVVAGDAVNDHALARFRRNGKLDQAFGQNGVAISSVSGLNRVSGVALQGDGKLVTVGYIAGYDASPLTVTRHLRNGELDTGFGSDGVVSTRFGFDTYVRGYGVAIQPDGKIVVSGEIGNGWIVARFSPDGAPDPGFGDGGVVTPTMAGRPHGLEILPDGRIVAGGISFLAGGNALTVAQYLTDGTPDPAFGEGGVKNARFNGGVSTGTDLVRQHDGKLIVVGSTVVGHDARFAVARFRANGTLDPSFSTNGVVMTGFRRRARPDASHDDRAEAVALMGRRRLVVAGYSALAGNADDIAIAVFRR